MIHSFNAEAGGTNVLGEDVRDSGQHDNAFLFFFLFFRSL